MKNGKSEGLYIDAKEFANHYGILSNELGFASGLIFGLLEFIEEHDMLEELQEWSRRNFE